MFPENAPTPNSNHFPDGTVVIPREDLIYLFFNGILVHRLTEPAGWDATDLDSFILNMAIGFSWHSHPSATIGNPKMTVRSIEASKFLRRHRTGPGYSRRHRLPSNQCSIVYSDLQGPKSPPRCINIVALPACTARRDRAITPPAQTTLGSGYIGGILST
jgi:hypothetical protein